MWLEAEKTKSQRSSFPLRVDQDANLLTELDLQSKSLFIPMATQKTCYIIISFGSPLAKRLSDSLNYEDQGKEPHRLRLQES
jgi:hypothetical protein